MSSLKVSLFGKFSFANGENESYPVRAHKVQELFVYLLVFRNHPQPRETLSETLWSDQPTIISRKNLRQTLWLLQSLFKEVKNSSSPELLIDDNWIHLCIPTGFWLDIAEFEMVFDLVNPRRAGELCEDDFKTMQSAVNLYKGDLLEGWYQDWCIFERERFQTMYLILLDKLVQYCEIHENYDAGLAYGWQILRQDQAYERAHRQMMRLYYLSGDRTQAIHQYQRCTNALRTQLGVEPSEKTRQLYEQIRLDSFKPSGLAPARKTSEKEDAKFAIADLFNRLNQFAATLKRMEMQVEEEITALENALSMHGR
jgi:DNA-binding SARP family transcriptional activator